MMNRDKLIALSHELEGDWLGMYEVLKQDKYLQKWKPKQAVAYEQAVTIYDAAYPKVLLGLRQPPFVLYYEGDLSLLKEDLTAVMGNFNPSDYGRAWAKTLEGPVVATLDHGISAAVLNERAVGIASFGLDNPFSKELPPSAGLVISEFPPAVPFSWRRYWRANHLLLDLGEALFVYELGAEDIRLRMVKSFMGEGLPVFVLPDRWGASKSAGGMSLLDLGAGVMGG